MNLDNFKNYLKINIDTFNSRKNYFNRVKCFFDKYDELTQENFNEYLGNKVDENISRSTFNQTMTAFRHYFKSTGEYIELPKYKKIQQKEKDFLTEKEFKYIIWYVPRIFGERALFYHFILRMLFYTGIRPDELVNLKNRDIDFDNQIFIIRNPKDRDDKKVPFPKHLIEDMQIYQNGSGNENAYDISYGTILHIITRINIELAYRKRLNPYMLRHSYARHMLAKGIPIEKLQILMGHSDLKTTMIYAKPRVEDAINDYFKKMDRATY